MAWPNMVEFGMHVMTVAAVGGLLILAAVLPFGGMGSLAVVPVTAAIAGAVLLLWQERRLAVADRKRRFRVVGPDEE